MTTFWIVSGAIALIILATLWRALYRGATGEAPAAYDLRVYGDQLAEVDRDLARGLLSEEEAALARTEVKRRILDADRALAAADTAPDSRTAPLTFASLGVLAIGLGAFAIYTQLGAPGYPDLPLHVRIEASETARLARPDQATAQAQFAPEPFDEAQLDPEYRQLLERLRATVAERPDDLRGFEFLARNEASIGNFSAAIDAQARVIELKGAEATANDHAIHGELMVQAAGGFVSPEAEAALNRALSGDPRNGPARFYLGIFYMQIDRPDKTFALWRPLLEESTPQAPWYEPLRAQINNVADAAGVRYVAPDTRGPSAADIAAAQDMAPEDRRAMIEGMVDGLANRLATEGGPPEDWVRLITSLMTLDQGDRARAIYDEALEVFKVSNDATMIIENAGRNLGFAP